MYTPLYPRNPRTLRNLLLFTTLMSKEYTISILYESPSCLVINKPRGVTVHPAKQTKSEVTLIEKLRKELKYKNLELVHRLDKETTGCLLVAKNPEVLAFLKKQFKDRTVKKIYLAIVAGVPREKKAMIDSPIGRSLVKRMKMSLFKTGKSREAITVYEVIDSADDVALLKCEIKTGRTHQIRVHLASLGHPVLGDKTYGNDFSRAVSEKYGVQTMQLHAQKLEFASPETKGSVQVEAPTPEDFHDRLSH